MDGYLFWLGYVYTVQEYTLKLKGAVSPFNFMEEHIEKFGGKPVFIDSHLRDPETLIDLIMDALAQNKPYNELEQYTEEQEEGK